MSHPLSVKDVYCIDLMTKIEKYIKEDVVKVIDIIRYNINFREVKKAVANICKRLKATALVFPVYSKHKVVSIHLIPI